MNNNPIPGLNPGLAEILRHAVELVDRGSEQRYKQANLPNRPRYTPILRGLTQGLNSISQFTKTLCITQGAVSQTVKLMEKEGLLIKKPGKEDAREITITLTKKGKALATTLQSHWQARFLAIENLEQETGIPLMENLKALVVALEQKDFAQRITEVEIETIEGAHHD